MNLTMKARKRKEKGEVKDPKLVRLARKEAGEGGKGRRRKEGREEEEQRRFGECKREEVMKYKENSKRDGLQEKSLISLSI